MHVWPAFLCRLLAIAFYATYYFGAFDSGNKCYGQMIINPINGARTAKVTGFDVDLMDNYDVGKKFHIWFFWGFV